MHAAFFVSLANVLRTKDENASLEQQKEGTHHLLKFDHHYQCQSDWGSTGLGVALTVKLSREETPLRARRGGGCRVGRDGVRPAWGPGLLSSPQLLGGFVNRL